MVWARVVYLVCYYIFIIFFTVVFRLKIKGKQNIPDKGAAILVANHSSLLDPFIVTCCTKRTIHWLVASWVFRIKPFAYLGKRIPFFKVEREKGNNKETLKMALTFLKEGRLIGVFPEGRLSRDDQLQPFLPGVTFLAKRSHSAVVPIFIVGAHNFLNEIKHLRLPSISVIIGESFFIPTKTTFESGDYHCYGDLISEKVLQLKNT